jgi:hypothetical protein
MDDALVGRCAKPEKSDHVVWNAGIGQLQFALAFTFTIVTNFNE